MANPEHLAKLQEGVSAWNLWREQNSEMIPDLESGNLSGIKLLGANLAGAKLLGASLNETDLRWANLSGADLSSADLGAGDLYKAILTAANLSRANLNGAELSRADLTRANLNTADLSGARLIRTNLTEANLKGVYFQNAALQKTIFDGAILTDVKLWETQRAGWFIKGIICERAYWDEKGLRPTEYTPGEFERLYAEQTSIELFYKGGISTFELNTLPALLQHLASKHPDANIQLKTIEQTGGGAKITISLGDADDSLKEKIEADAMQVVRAQLSLRENENLRLQIQNDLLREQHRETVRLMLSSAAPQITFNAPVHTAALPSGNAKVELHQTFNDNTELIQLIDKLLTRNTELTAPQSAEIEAAKTELQKPDPDKSLLTRTLGFLKALPKEAILKGVGKLGERAAEADWSSLLHQLGEFIHHLH